MRNTAALRFAQHAGRVCEHVGPPFEHEGDHTERRPPALDHVAFALTSFDQFANARRRALPHTQTCDHVSSHALAELQPARGAPPCSRALDVQGIFALDLRERAVVFQPRCEALEKTQNRRVARLGQRSECGRGTQNGCVRGFAAAFEISTSSPNSASGTSRSPLSNFGRGTSFSPTSTWTSSAAEARERVLDAGEFTADLVRFLGASGQGVTAPVAYGVILTAWQEWTTKPPRKPRPTPNNCV